MIVKYPRTPHLAGSALQVGDDGSDRMTIAALKAAWPDADIVFEEKLDGANAGISFSDDLDLRLQSRGHYLAGGAREAQFGPLKSWACHQEAVLLEALEDRFIMYGEWLFARHTMFYDALPHLFFEFDNLDVPAAEAMRRNRRRDEPVPDQVILDLARKREVIMPEECHSWVSVDAMGVETRPFDRPVVELASPCP